MKAIRVSISFILCIFLGITNVTFASGWLTDENGTKVWSSSETIEGESFKWYGRVVDGYAEGRAALELFLNGKLIGRYVGNMHQGKRDGTGVYHWFDGPLIGCKYEGDFRDNARTGKGTLKYPSGETYQGDFLDGMRHGVGAQLWKNEARYQGEWINDRPKGGQALGETVCFEEFSKVFNALIVDKSMPFVEHILSNKGMAQLPYDKRYEGYYKDIYIRVLVRERKILAVRMFVNHYDWLQNAVAMVGQTCGKDEEEIGNDIFNAPWDIGYEWISPRWGSVNYLLSNGIAPRWGSVYVIGSSEKNRLCISLNDILFSKW